MSLPLWPEANYSLPANLAALLCNNGRYLCKSESCPAMPSVGLVIFHIIPMLERWLCLMVCGFCCTHGEGTGIHSYSPQQTLGKNETTGRIERETPAHFNAVPGFGSLWQETILCTFLKRLGKALASHLDTDWAQRTAVNCPGQQGLTGISSLAASVFQRMRDLQEDKRSCQEKYDKCETAIYFKRKSAL